MPIDSPQPMPSAASDRTAIRRAALVIVAMVGLRLLIAALTPLAFDEAYYWLWSQHLAAGYYDHPPMVALVVRLGTLIAGDTELGVRLVSVLLMLPASFAVYRTGAILCGSARVGATAAVLFNVTMMAWLGTILVSPDAPLMLASSLVMWALAKLLQTQRGVWWLAVGAAVGFGLLSKYNALFFGPSILIWVVAVPRLRRWLVTPWPYLGALIALVLFSPTLVWNAQHDWASLIKQFGRVGAADFKPVFLVGMLAGQFIVMTPVVAILGFSGLTRLGRIPVHLNGASMLIHAVIWVVIGYFLMHALHEEVHPNWLCQIYPALAIAAAVAIEQGEWGSRWQRTVEFLRRCAVPGSVAMVAIIVIHVHTGLFTGFGKDESARLVGIGFPDVARQVEQLRQRAGARCVLSSDYGLTSWLAFYLPRGSCVVQRNERIRWVNMPEPDAALLQGPLLYVDAKPADPTETAVFGEIETIGQIARTRSGVVVASYRIDRVAAPRGEVIDRSPPPELIKRPRF